ncbi:MAG: tetratricopeptide repeat protein [Verrucomicrobiia bacterium]|jgi:tetratricopeptide (TPR) repeat protein
MRIRESHSCCRHWLAVFGGLLAALACALPARAQVITTPATNTNRVVGGMSINHTLVIKDSGALCNVASWSIRNHLVASNNTVHFQFPPGAGVSSGTNVSVRRAKEHALAKVAALDSAAGLLTPPASTSAQAPAATETTRMANTATNTVAQPSPPHVTTPSPPSAPPSSSPQFSTDLKPLMVQVRELYGRKQFEEAAAKSREILKHDPENLVVLTNLGVIRFQQGRLEEAEYLFNRALQIAPNDAYIHATVGIIYFKQDRIDDAIGELTRSTKLNPNDAEARNYLGLACWKKGWCSTAEQELRRAIELQPDSSETHYNLAVIYTSKELPFLGLAKFHYRKTLELGRPHDSALEEILAGEKLEE